MTEPSLSADLAATLQTTTATISSLFRSLKELSHTVDVESNMKAARLDNLEQMHAKGGAHTAVYSRVTREERVRGIQHVEHSQRLEALEKKTNGLIQMRADHGHQFIVIIDRVKALEERVVELEEKTPETIVARLEELLEAFRALELAEPMPLPKEDLD